MREGGGLRGPGLMGLDTTSVSSPSQLQYSAWHHWALGLAKPQPLQSCPVTFPGRLLLKKISHSAEFFESWLVS
jgi:hypothetical protein